MEKIKKYCVQCHQLFVSKRNPNQYYCTEPICQIVRKRQWRKQKLLADADYHQNQRRAEQSWRKRHPEYWKKYREQHPLYAECNRKQQCIRQQKKRSARTMPLSVPATEFANSDALPEGISPKKPIKPGTYRITPVANSEFANSDAFIVTIALISTS